MAGGAGSARGRAGKYNKPKRGGGKSFSRGLQPTDGEGNQVSMWAEDAQDRSDEDDSEEDESEEEEDSDDEAGPSKAAAVDPSGSGNREDRKAQKKARKEAAIAKQKSKTVEVGDLPSSGESDDDDDDDDDGDMPANPNHSKSARKQADAGVEEVTEGVKNLKAPQNRREREAMEAQIAKEKYLKLQAEGKTDQAKADLARLKLIREQRAADAARRQAEDEERAEQEKARKAEIDAREAKKREAAMGPKKSGKKK